MAVVSFWKYGSVNKLNRQIGTGRLFTHWLYIDRSYPRKGLPGSPLANPWNSNKRVKDAIHVQYEEIAFTNYRAWLWKQMKSGNQEVIAALKKIDKKTALVCCCQADDVCHGHIVEQAARWLKTNEGKQLLNQINL